MVTATQLKTAATTAANTYMTNLASGFGFQSSTDALMFALSHDPKFRKLGQHTVILRDQVFQIVRQALLDAVPANITDATAWATTLSATFPVVPAKATLEADMG